MYNNTTHKKNLNSAQYFKSISSYSKHTNRYNRLYTYSVNDIRYRFTKTVLSFLLCIALIAIIYPIIAITIFLLITTIISIIKLTMIACAMFLEQIDEKHILKDIIQLQDFSLYTIVVPLFMERRRDIIAIRQNLFKIKYPKIEILYLIEDIDSVAIHTFNNLALKPCEQYIIIPRIPPFTKPKACNYALEFACGRYIVVYDVEDKPHPYQLHMAHYMFIQNNSISCIQFPLEFSHGSTIQEIWQKIDYILWYNYLVKFFAKINIPIPLGGTSNHFLVKDLRMAGGWDSYNVTEDAEIGIRMASLGYNIQYCGIFATTEKPLRNLVSLFNQRVRWSKGHLMTAIQTGPRLIKAQGIPACLTFFLLISQWILFPVVVLLLLMGYAYPIFYGNSFLVILVCINITIFLTMPLLYLIIIKECRSPKMLIPLFTYNIFHIFYIGILTKALHEVILSPYKWYKTLR